MRRTAPAFAVLLLLLGAVVAIAAELAFPPLTGRVVDEAGVLDAATKARLEQKLAVQERTSGDQVVVATLRSLQGNTVEDYANRLFRHWQIGQAKQNNGALLVVAPNERKVRIEVGYGLEGVITDAASSTIIQSLILPRFRAGDLAGGIEAGVRGILELMSPADDTRPPGQGNGWSQPRPQQPSDGPGWVVVVFLILVVLVVGSIFRGGRRGPPGYYRRRYGAPPVIILPGGFGGSGGGFGGSGGGGGFSGGGGSSGGGGASGSW